MVKSPFIERPVDTLPPGEGKCHAEALWRGEASPLAKTGMG